MPACTLLGSNAADCRNQFLRLHPLRVVQVEERFAYYRILVDYKCTGQWQCQRVRPVDALEVRTQGTVDLVQFALKLENNAVLTGKVVVDITEQQVSDPQRFTGFTRELRRLRRDGNQRRPRGR